MGVGGARRAERRGRRRPGHGHEPRRLDRQALAGSILIAAPTTSFITNIEQSPAIPADVKNQASVKLKGVCPSCRTPSYEDALDEAGASSEVAQAALDSNADARLDGLRAALFILALVAIVALFFAERIPSQPRSAPG
jgi:hypothetical protein